MDKTITEFRQQLRKDIVNVLYDYYFGISQNSIEKKRLYDKLNKSSLSKEKIFYTSKCPDGLGLSYEVNGALAYLCEIGYLKHERRFMGWGESMEDYYRITVLGIDHFEANETNEK